MTSLRRQVGDDLDLCATCAGQECAYVHDTTSNWLRPPADPDEVRWEDPAWATWQLVGAALKPHSPMEPAHQDVVLTEMGWPVRNKDWSPRVIQSRVSDAREAGFGSPRLVGARAPHPIETLARTLGAEFVYATAGLTPLELAAWTARELHRVGPLHRKPGFHRVGDAVGCDPRTAAKYRDRAQAKLERMRDQLTAAGVAALISRLEETAEAV